MNLNTIINDIRINIENINKINKDLRNNYNMFNNKIYKNTTENKLISIINNIKHYDLPEYKKQETYNKISNLIITDLINFYKHNDFTSNKIIFSLFYNNSSFKIKNKLLNVFLTKEFNINLLDILIIILSSCKIPENIMISEFKELIMLLTTINISNNNINIITDEQHEYIIYILKCINEYIKKSYIKHFRYKIYNKEIDRNDIDLIKCDFLKNIIYIFINLLTNNNVYLYNKLNNENSKLYYDVENYNNSIHMFNNIYNYYKTLI